MKISKQPLRTSSWLSQRLKNSLLIALLCLLGFSQQTIAGGWNKVYQNPNSVITPDNPFASYIVHIYNNNDKGSYLDSDLEVWMDDVIIGQFDVDWDDEGTLQKRIDDGKTYPLINNNYGWKGIAIPWKNDGNNYSVSIYLSHPNQVVGDKHTIYFRAKWVSDRGSGSWQNTSTYNITVGTKDDAWSTTTPNGIMYLDAENYVHYECDKYPQIPDGCSIDINIGSSYGNYTSAIRELPANTMSTEGEEQPIKFSHIQKRNESQDYYLQNIIKKKDVYYPEKELFFGDINFYVKPTTPITCKGFATPRDLKYEYNADVSIKDLILKWSIDNTSRDTDGKWSIFSQKVSDGELKNIANIENTKSSYTVSVPELDVEYNYYVCFLPAKHQDESFNKLLPNLYTSLENVVVHNIIPVPAKAATCTTSGNKAYWQCASCGDIFSDAACTTKTTMEEMTIAALGHKMTAHAAVDATCAKDGHLLYYTCSRECCAGNYYNGTEGTETYANKEATVVKATGHHTFADNDMLQSVCTACNHGFLRYTSKSSNAAINITDKAIFSTISGAQNAIISNTNNAGNGVIEFKEPLGSIADYAFLNNSDLTGKMYIPNTVRTIGLDAFGGCDDLKDIVLNSIPAVAGNSLEGKDVHMQLTDESYVYTDMEQPMELSTPATYTRKAVKNEWGTIVLPFDANGNADCEFFTLSSITDDELVLTTVKEMLPANTPTIFRLNSTLVDGKTHDLVLTAANNNAKASIVDGPSANGLTMTSNYSIADISNKGGYFISHNAFWNIATSKGSNQVWLAPFRAYLAGAISSDADILSISINNSIEDEDETGIEAINALTSGDAEYYDINGGRINTLQKGVNIVKFGNGKTKKVTIR